MNAYPFYLVNVFAESHFGGNPLAVFPTADGLNDQQMQAIAKQFNLSETAFVIKPSDKKAVADLRIFTPNYEMPFAGHPTLGSAFVLKMLNALSDNFWLKTKAKAVAIYSNGNHISLGIQGYQIYPINHLADLATICGLNHDDVVDGCFVNAGVSQLLVQLNHHQALKNVRVDLQALKQMYRHSPFGDDEPMVYLWCEQGETVFARMFFEQNGVAEDSGTGSACANLGAYFVHHNRYPIAKKIHQGDDMGRPNRLHLTVDSEQQIHVGGDVMVVGKGEFCVP